MEKTIEMKMDLCGYMHSLILLLENGNSEGQAFARSEIMRLAKEIQDFMVKQNNGKEINILKNPKNQNNEN